MYISEHPQNGNGTSVFEAPSVDEPRDSWRSRLIGRPLPTADMPHQAVRKVVGLAVFASDALSSTAYATQEMFVILAVAGTAAYGLAKTSSRHKGQITYLFLLCQMIPPIAVVISFFIIAQMLGLIDTLSSLIIFELLWTIPLAVWLLRGYFINFPTALTESAQVDGASLFQAILRIVVPMVAPAILATSIFVFIRAWNDFVLAFFITVMKARTLPTTIDFYLVYTQIEWGLMFAAATLTTLPIVIFAILNRRYFVRGGTMGAIKE